MENFEISLINKLSEICKGIEEDNLEKQLVFLSKKHKSKEKKFFFIFKYYNK